MSRNWRIASPWRLRNDRRYVVAYKCIIDTLEYCVLSPYQAAIAPFLDGTLTDEQLWQAWCSVFDLADNAQDVQRKIFAQQIDCMRRTGLITEEGPLSPSLVKERTSLVPDFGAYNVPKHRLDTPVAVTATLTNYCRTDCVYCYAERKIECELNFEEWIGVFDELRDNEIYIVDTAGGDIFARKDVIGLLTEMVKREFAFFISTKCPIDMTLAARLAELGIGRLDVAPHLRRDIQVSVDSSDPLIADRLVGRKNYLARAKHSVENCVAAGMAPRVKSVLTSLNPSAAEGIVGFFEPLGVRAFQFVQYGRTHYRHDDALFLSLDQKLRIRDQAEAIRARYPHVEIIMQDDLSMGESANADWKSWSSRTSCSAGRLQMVIKPNGDVTLCDQIPQDENFVIANVKELGVMGAWRSPRIDQFLAPSRDSFKGEPCFDCSGFDDCHAVDAHGYCFRDSLFLLGNMFAPPPACPRQTRVGLRAI